MVTGVVPSSPRFLSSIFIAHRVQQSHCLSIFDRVLLTHALALSASQFVHKKKSPRTFTSMHSGGFELTKLTYTRLEDNLTRHRGDHVHPSTSSTARSVPCWRPIDGRALWSQTTRHRHILLLLNHAMQLVKVIWTSMHGQPQ